MKTVLVIRKIAVLCKPTSSQSRRGGRGGERSRYKIPGPGDPEGGLGPDYLAYVFLGSIIIYRLYKLTLSDQDQAQITQQLRVSLSHIV